MEEVHIFAINIKKYTNMRKNNIKTNRGEMGLGAIMLLLILGVFILWVLTGSKKTIDSNDYFVKPQQINTNFPQ